MPFIEIQRGSLNEFDAGVGFHKMLLNQQP